MGKSGRAKPRGKPRSVLASGTDGPVQGTTIQTLLVALIAIDQHILMQTSVGDAVTVSYGTEIEVHTSRGRLGNVPPYLRDVVADLRPGGGKVVELAQTPSSRAKVHLK